MKTLWVLILFATVGFTAKDAIACSCAGPYFENALRLGNGVIPENARGLGWHFTRAEEAGALEELVTITRLDKPAVDNGFVIEPVVEGSTVFTIRPNEWEVGAQFDVSTVFQSDEPYTNNRHFARGIFEIGEPLLSFPEELWISETSIEKIRVNEGTSCDAQVLGAIATIGLSGGLEINLVNLDFETFVDGERYAQTSSSCEYIEPGRNWYNRIASDRLVAICGSPDGYDIPGLKSGTHTVQIRATLPGTNVSFDTLSTDIELTCPETVPDNTNTVDAENDGGCTSIRSSPAHPILFFLFVLAAIRFRRN